MFIILVSGRCLLRPGSVPDLNVTLLPLDRRGDTTRMEDIERNHENHHQERIEPIEKDFML